MSIFAALVFACAATFERIKLDDEMMTVLSLLCCLFINFCDTSQNKRVTGNTVKRKIQYYASIPR